MTWIAPSTDFRALSKWCAVLYLPVSMLNEDRSTPGSKKKSGSFPNSAIRCYSNPCAKTQARCDGCPPKGESIEKVSRRLLKNSVCRLLKKISEARRAKNRRAEAYLASTL